MAKYTVVITLLTLICSGVVQGATYTFSPYVNDLGDLAHQYYFTWGIKWNLPQGEEIASATLTYKNIWDWTVETDHLYTHLLDTVSAASGWKTVSYYQTVTIQQTDNQGGGDNFAGQGVLLGVWSDPYGGSPRNFDLVYDIPLAYFSWLSDGNFGFGIDPDCHYYNDGIELKIVTSSSNQVIPEPFSVALASLGLGVIAGVRRLSGK